MVAQIEAKRIYSPEEYLELEIPSVDRHEYINGEIRLMPGGMPNHNQIIGNLYATLNFALKRQPYRIFLADQRLWIPDRRIYTYPDIMIMKEPLEYQEGRKDTLVNPFLIVEVLSGSTRNYDKDEKFAAYRTIPIFQEYILIEQYTPHIEHYVKTGSKQWTFQEYDEIDSILNFSSLPFEISSADIYDKVEFISIEADPS